MKSAKNPGPPRRRSRHLHRALLRGRQNPQRKKSSAASPPSSNTSNPPPPASASPVSTASSTGRSPSACKIEAGAEVGRHPCMTHCYWREGGPQFGNVNIMGVVHGTDRDLIMQHKAAIDAHLESCGIPVEYTNVFWGGRSEIKPSEISPVIYADWHAKWRGVEGPVI
jgi:hypothetical protein